VLVSLGSHAASSDGSLRPMPHGHSKKPLNGGRLLLLVEVYAAACFVGPCSEPPAVVRLRIARLGVPLGGRWGDCMRSLVEKGGVAAVGLVTSLLTAVGVTLVDRLIGLNLFTFSVFVVIPAGAALCGFAAASGYYFGAKYLHQRPTKALLAQMVLVAAATQFLIYWFEYQSLVIEGVRVADVASFGQYLDASLITAHMKVGRGLAADTGEVGSFGYWLAVIDFIGFLVGGAFVYAKLVTEPACEECGKYLRTAVKKADSFPTVDDFAAYYDGVYENPVGSEEFADHVGRDYSAGAAEKGTVNLTTTVLECPQCFRQSIRETVQVFNGNQWNDANDLTRWVEMPNGVDVRPVFSSALR
jgi:hypothetical protein